MKKLAIAAAAVLSAASGSVEATTFNFTFTDIRGGGKGVLSVEKTLTAGAYKLSEVGAYSLDFTAFGSSRFTNANIKTTPSTVLLIVSGEVGALTMVFSNTAQYGDGPREGSLDLMGDTTFMAFIPPAAFASEGGANFYTVGAYRSRPFPARYSAVEAPVAAIPEPATWSMLLLGFGMIAGTARYRRRTTNMVSA